MIEYNLTPTKTYDTIKLGIDAHAKWYYVARQLDGATPQPVQKMDIDGLLHFVAKQQRLAREVHTCYEAGAFGYYLHRRLEAIGVRNLVVQPQDWDERGKGVKTDRIDALALCQRLDRYVRGNRKAFSVVRVPSEEEERERGFSRQRQQLVRERQRLQAMGRSLLAMHGIHVSGKWWKGKTWATIRSEAPAWVMERLRVFIVLIEPVEAEERKLTEAIQEAARDRQIPKGVGPLSFEVLRREVGDWSRFNNYPALRARSAGEAPPVRDAAIAAGAVAAGLELHRAVSAGTQQRREATGWERQQERQPAGASDARGDGVADDTLATGLPRAAQMDVGSGRFFAQCGGAQEGDRGALRRSKRADSRLRSAQGRPRSQGKKDLRETQPEPKASSPPEQAAALRSRTNPA